MKKIRQLVIVLGDQLDRDAAAFDGFDPALDCIWMAEVMEESTQAWSHKQRIVMFLSAMRHFRNELREAGLPLEYTELPDAIGGLSESLHATVERLKPASIVVTRPGEWRVLEMIREVSLQTSVPLDLREDRHFFTTPADFEAHAKGRKSLRMEYFYRDLRRRFDILMEAGEPAGNAWNFDKENRGNFGRSGPSDLPEGPGFAPDDITREVMELVAERFADHPGELDLFRWPTNRADALTGLDRFIRERLPNFGNYQDAMWTDQPWLYHSLISTSLNLKLLNPREVIEAAEQAYRSGQAPIQAVEGFIRQILGWREFVRGIYWLKMPDYAAMNYLEAHRPLPDFFWSGDTGMNCMQQSIDQTRRFAYAHHIQRLMVLGNFALLAGIDPAEVNEWYLVVYADAYEWVELPNVSGMVLFADGGYLASKPYAAGGAYINRMSNYCSGCTYKVAKKNGEGACPFNYLYWDFLIRNRDRLGGNARMGMMYRSLDRMAPEKIDLIRADATRFLAEHVPAA